MYGEFWVDVLPPTGDKAIVSLHWIKVTNNYMKSDIERWMKEQYGRDCRVFIASCPQWFGGHGARPEAYTDYRR